MNGFAGMVAVVTGATSGIGLATATHLAALGATVVCNASRQPPAGVLDPVANHAFCLADISDRADVVGLAEYVRDTFGRLDYLVANAGIAPVTTSGGSTAENIHRTIAVNQLGTHYCLDVLGQLIQETSAPGGASGYARGGGAMVTVS